MNKSKVLPFIIIVIFLFAFGFIFAFSRLVSCSETQQTETYIDPLYKFELAEYNLTYDVAGNCKIAVTEDITVNYLGYASTGFIRDIPVNAGTQVRNVKVEKLDGSSPSFWYGVDFEYANFVSVDIGDSSPKHNKTETYRLTYDYIITNKVIKKSLLPLNVIGTGWACDIHNASVTLNLPEGYESAKCYTGKSGSTNEFTNFTVTAENGKTQIFAEFDELGAFNGVTFDLQFKKGAISNYVDFTPFIFVIVAALIFGAAAAVKFTVFNKLHILPVVNYEAPNKMNPLLMGKLIDNKIDSEDITSMLYYWASKGYIKINFDDKKDPLIIRIVQSLPNGTPDYERTLYNGLFDKNGDTVKTSQLKNSYYKHIDAATRQLNSSTKYLYNKTSIIVAVVFAVLCGFILGLAPLVLAFVRISNKVLYIFGMFMIVPAVLVNLFTQALMITKHKMKKQNFIICAAAIGLVCVIISVLYMFIPSGIMGTAAKIVLGLVCMGTAAFSAVLIARTERYNAELGDILGFKDFISLAEKDRLEMMLEEDPQIYYSILPYAQVLGVSDIWEEKFKDLTVPPPQWATGDMVRNIVAFHVMNGILRSSMRGISSNMNSRPSSSGLSGGGHGGGFGGGHSGGGFGGGGGRGR